MDFLFICCTASLGTEVGELRGLGRLRRLRRLGGLGEEGLGGVQYLGAWNGCGGGGWWIQAPESRGRGGSNRLRVIDKVLHLLNGGEIFMNIIYFRVHLTCLRNGVLVGCRIDFPQYKNFENDNRKMIIGSFLWYNYINVHFFGLGDFIIDIAEFIAYFLLVHAFLKYQIGIILCNVDRKFEQLRKGLEIRFKCWHIWKLGDFREMDGLCVR